MLLRKHFLSPFLHDLELKKATTGQWSQLDCVKTPRVLGIFAKVDSTGRVLHNFAEHFPRTLQRLAYNPCTWLVYIWLWYLLSMLLQINWERKEAQDRNNDDQQSARRRYGLLIKYMILNLGVLPNLSSHRQFHFQ